MNRTLLILSGIFVALGLGVGVYFLFFSSAPMVTVTPTNTATLPSAGAQQNTQTTGTQAGPTVANPSPATVAQNGRLVQISTSPVVFGSVAFDTPAKSASSSPEVFVRYMERESGNVFSYAASTRTITRINNKTIPGIQSAVWLPDGSAAYVQYLSGTDLSTVNTYILSATSSQGSFLPQNLLGVDVSSSTILTLASGVNGSMVSTARADGSRATTVFTTPLSSLRAAFAGKDQYLAFTKPSALLGGYAFLVDKRGTFSRIAGPLTGLSALPSPSGKWILVSYSDSHALHMQLISTVGSSTQPIALPVTTMTEKCVWTADDAAIYCGVPSNLDSAYTYPDDWYQGVVQLSDRIWKIDVAGRYAQFVLDFSKVGKGDLDATALSIDQKKSLLIFTNKNDGSLWGLTL